MASYTVPFMGMVFHGYINYAGTATGMASDIDREILRMIENGAAPFFTVAYQNTSSLKNDPSYSDYYSIDYAICFEQIVETYKTVNEQLADLQTATITGHDFIKGIRALSAKEQAVVDKLMEEAKENFDAVYAAAVKSYEDRKYLAELHGKAFDEIFEETYSYFFVYDEETDTYTKDVDTYVQYVYDEYCATLDRVVAGGNLILVEYTRKDGTTKTFVLNYGAYDATVVVDGQSYPVSANGFAVVGQ